MQYIVLIKKSIQQHNIKQLRQKRHKKDTLKYLIRCSSKKNIQFVRKCATLRFDEPLKNRHKKNNELISIIYFYIFFIYLHAY